MQIYDFSVVVFRQYSKKFKKFLSRFRASFFETFSWLGLGMKTPFDQKFQPKWVITVLGENFWVKTLLESRGFRMTSSGLEKILKV